MGLETLLAIGAGTQAIGSVVGGVTASGAAGTAATTAQREAEYNALVAEREALLARIEAGIEASRIQRAGRRLVSTQRAVAAKSGVDVSQGSPLLIMLDTIQRAAEDASLALFRGEVRAEGLETTAEVERTAGSQEAKILRTQGRRALITGTLGIPTAALGFVTQREILKKQGVI